MKPLRIAFPLLILASLGLAACFGLPSQGQQAIEGSGKLAEETRTIDAPASVQLSMMGTLHIEIGSPASLRISAEDNLLPQIESDVRGGGLDLRTTPGIEIHPSQPIDFYLTVPSLDEIRITSSGDVEAPALAATRFTADISSSGSMTIASLQAETLRVEISSSGNVEILGGTVGYQDIRISSSGEYAAKDLLSTNASVRLSSSGGATIQVAENLDATLSSSGSVYYLGSPQLNVNTSSSGRAVPAGN